jgi:CRISPR-associated protein Cmr1
LDASSRNRKLAAFDDRSAPDHIDANLRASRMTVVQLHYTVRFLCPSFLGNAEQRGQWRTPPFKALLRQWWRVAYAADHRFSVDVDRMRTAEGRLFGAAADANSNTSRVRLRLDRWDEGRLRSWQPLTNVFHPEVAVRRQGAVVGVGRDVGSDLYLGFGPLILRDNRTAFKANAAIQAGEDATLRFALDSKVGWEESARIAKALALIDLYGTVGGRSRNGWGSLMLEPHDRSAALPPVSAEIRRPWRDALALDWPHAIGRDEKGTLIWQTEAFGDWKAAMRRLAEIKIGLRTQFKFEQPPHRQPNERHWLSYPVTHHPVRGWGERLRLPNSLRFKLRRDNRDESKLRGVVFHVPCLPPVAFNPDRSAIASVWQGVHHFLDQPAQNLSRIAA